METQPDVIGPINLGNPHEFTIRNLAELILELTGSRSKIVHRPLPEDDPRNGGPISARPRGCSAGVPPSRLRRG